MLRTSRPAVATLATIFGLAGAGLVVSPKAQADLPGVFPAVSSVAPNSGSVHGGERVTITGTGFRGLFNACRGSYQVSFGMDTANEYGISSPTVNVISDTKLTAVVPQNFGGAVDVQVTNRCGTSIVQARDRFTYVYPPDQCLTGSCRVEVSASTIGRLTHAADGFLNGFNNPRPVRAPPSVAALVQAVSPKQWQLGQLDPGLDTAVFGYCQSCRRSAEISLDLTTDWENWAYTNDRPAWRAPFVDLPTYYRFIYGDVMARIHTGEVPSYYDVWNEPEWGSINNWLSVYGTAYRAIKSADPSAQVLGPSIAAFLVPSPGDLTTPGYDLNLTDFLNWELSTGVRFAAIAWHEDGSTVRRAPNSGYPGAPVPGGLRDVWSPAAIGQHVAIARALLASHPALASTKVFVNEYGPTYGANIPGWMVGAFAALEGSQADQGMLTCATVSACTDLWDGLIGFDGAPQMPYWVMLAYAHMGGARVRVSTPAANVYTLATRVDKPRSLQVLAGRVDDCFDVQCPQFRPSRAPPVRLAMSISIPWRLTAVTIAIRSFPNNATGHIGSNDVPVPPTTITIPHVRVVGHTATVSIPAVHDGDAFYMTVSPAARRRAKR